MEVNKILNIATLAGKIMLQSGAETYRVEETINRICKSYNVTYAESFVMPTGIMVSIVNDGQTYSLINRIKDRTVDLHKIDRVNQVAREIEIEKYSIEELEKKLINIENEERYSNLKTILFSGIGAFGFVFLFNGTVKDAISAFFIGMIIKYLNIEGNERNINSFFINSICAGVLAFLAIVSIKIGVADSLDKVIIGAIMLLVPGLAITNAIRDTVNGDIVSGLARGAEAFLIAISVAIGTGAVLSLWIRMFGGI